MKKITLYLLILFSFVFFQNCDNDGEPNAEKVICFKSIENTLVADDNSSVEIRIAINKKADASFNEIELTTDLGHFKNDEKTIMLTKNINNEFNTTLFSETTTGIAHLRATINSISIDTTISFVKSMPDYIQVNPVISTTTKNDPKLCVNLLRKTGTIGEEIKVSLAYQGLDSANAQAQLNLQPFVVLKEASDSIKILNPLAIKGRFEIIASTINQEMDTISAKSTLIFQ